MHVILAPVALSLNLPLPPLLDLGGLVESAAEATVNVTKGVLRGSWNVSVEWHNTTVGQPESYLPVKQIENMTGQESQDEPFGSCRLFFSFFLLLFSLEH